MFPFNLKNRLIEFVLSRYPLKLNMELVNACNADCIFCAYRYQGRAKGIMSDEVFKRAIDEYCKIGGGELTLTPTVGDPLLDGKLLSRIRYARSQPEIKDIGFFTNLLSFHRFDLSEFLDSGITNINISTCIKNESTYRKIFQADGYQQLLTNIKNLSEGNRRSGNPIRLKLCLRVPKPYEEVLESRDYKSISGYFDKEAIEFDQAGDVDSWGGRIKSEDLPSGHNIRANIYSFREGVCVQFYGNINVLYDGRVNFCACRDLNSEFIIGHIMQEGILEIWRGEKLKKYRKDWKREVYPSMCSDCTWYSPVIKMTSGREAKFLERCKKVVFNNWSPSKLSSHRVD